MARYIN